MLARTGNLAEVYAQFWKIQAVALGIETAINFVVSKSAPVDCEISDEHPARWYLVHCYPGNDVNALRWLARRKFGAFRAMKQREDKRNGTKLQGWEAAFSGWLFVYTWDIKRMRSRILSLPGIMEIFRDPVSQQPIPIPDWFIDRLREETYKYKDNAPHAQYGRLYHEVERHVQRYKKRRKRPGKRIKAKVKRGSSTTALTESGTGVTPTRPAVAGPPSGCG